MSAACTLLRDAARCAGHRNVSCSVEPGRATAVLRDMAWKIDSHVCVADTVSDPKDPTAFFLSCVRENEVCDLFVFASPDESVFGRTASIARLGSHHAGAMAVALTLTDRHLTGERLGRLVGEVRDAINGFRMARQDLASLVPPLKRRDDLDGAQETGIFPGFTVDVLFQHMDIKRELVLSEPESRLERDLRSMLGDHALGWAWRGADPGERADMATLFGGTTLGEPARLSSERDGPVSLAGGAIEVAYAVPEDVLRRPDRDVPEEEYNAAEACIGRKTCVRAGVGLERRHGHSRKILVAPDVRNDMYTPARSIDAGDATTVFFVTSVPMAHVAMVIEAVKAEPTDSRVCDLLGDSVDAKRAREIAQAVAEREVAVASIGAVMRRNMGGIKARLWRPGGRLQTTHMESELGGREAGVPVE